MSAMKKKAEENELGFGTKTSVQKTRLINKDGGFNVDRVEVSRWGSTSIYHALITMSWRKFNLIIFIYFITINLFFACLYFFSGMEGLRGVEATTKGNQFLEAFFFSSQTIPSVNKNVHSPELINEDPMDAYFGFNVAEKELYESSFSVNFYIAEK